MHQARGECPQRGHLLLLHGHALQPLKPLPHVGKNGLADLRATGHQAPELLLVELQQMAWHRRLEIHTVRNICQKRYFAEGVPALDLVKSALLSVGLRVEYANLALEQYP